ncbi:hypothetical protein MIR68_001193 [Amoeboaphelidium protococcarum]|nr:hypothetical protein MIR68_001193 [Amoeboaphelidium protococcarum]
MNTVMIPIALALLASVLAVPTVSDINDAVGLDYSQSPPDQCPPTGLRSVPNLNLTAYTYDRWFIQYQTANSYQSPDQLFCVSAYYKIQSVGQDPSWYNSFFRWIRYGPGVTTIDVYNYANRGVNGEVTQGNLSAIALDAQNNPGDLLVGPGFLPRWLYGPYTIVAAYPGPDRYDWAIISGGLPKNKNATTGYCSTKSAASSTVFDNGNDQGFWFFHRKQVASTSEIDSMFKTAKALGYETGNLIKVQQDGCEYKNIQFGVDPTSSK